MGCFIKRIIQFKQAMRYQKLIVFDADKLNVSDKCFYSWSVDGVCWTGWMDYANYNSIAPTLDSDFYLKILISGSLRDIVVNDCITRDYNISLDSSNIFLKDFCSEPNLFQPYNNLDCALQLQNQLSDSIVCMFGIPIYYIKVSPNQETADYNFKEYILHNVEDIKQIKLMIPDGQMPSSNPKLTEFDFDWETDWETELSKSQFATAFGDDSFPKQRDIIYIPMMKRMWEVNSAYDEKNEGLMWRSTTWKLALVKYNEKTNINTGDFENIIDGWVANKYEEVFGSKETKEQEIESQSPQIDSPVFSATNLYDIFMEDAIRKQYTKQDVTILDSNINHRSNVVARNIYKFKNENGCVTYQKGYCGENGTLMFIMETPGSLPLESKEILNFGEIKVNLEYKDNNFILEFNGMTQNLSPFQTYMIILKWDRNNFVTEMDIYLYTHREGVPVYKLRPEMYWFDFENPIVEKTSAYNNEFATCVEQPCSIHSYPCQISNIKYYNSYLNKDIAIKESIKYTTDNKACIINDLARPINSGRGYNVK